MDLSALLVVAAVAAAVPLLRGLLPGRPLPGPVMEILAGIALGPSLLGLLAPDGTVRSVGTLGLAFLLLLAGSEIELDRLRGPLGRATGLGLLVSVALAAVAAGVLSATGLVGAPLLVSVALTGTSLGLLVPLLTDAGLVRTPLGRAVLAGSSAGEVVAILGLSLLAGTAGAPARAVAVLAVLGAVVLAVVLLVHAARAWPAVGRVVRGMADTSGQLRVRLVVLLVLALTVAAETVGLEAILGAFLAGLVLRALDPDGERTHPQLRVKLDGLAHGFLVPVFFIGSGLAVDLRGLVERPSALLLVPVLLLLLVLVRAVPAVVLVHLGRRERVAAGLLQATSLPLFVTAAAIGTETGALVPTEASAMVVTGLLAVVVLPAAALRLLPRNVSAPPRTRPRADV